MGSFLHVWNSVGFFVMLLGGNDCTFLVLKGLTVNTLWAVNFSNKEILILIGFAIFFFIFWSSYLVYIILLSGKFFENFLCSLEGWCCVVEVHLHPATYYLIYLLTRSFAKSLDLITHYLLTPYLT